ncbi:hypothetical protein F2P56_009269 [Juglans regia]|uniref:Glucan endo-1,3-beta-glucosidase 13-like n=2 Tax=Juglans regia TaxID=51240 RepID=A0A2I4E779_JUGRE|nr:glucan endo-1,3-beta-glucosidase 13-like [Juglans regia]KAF5472558.1 hypothetical protein F2P56_009269 [Juglans regia]
MTKKMWALQYLLLIECYLVLTAEGHVVQQQKVDAGIPVITLSPPEGNTTFLDGTTWCVALAGVPQVDLQDALDWACGLGMVDCKEIQQGGKCFEPETLLSHASYAFNNYYQQNGNSDIACNFGGTAAVTKNNPSYGKCVYSTPGSISSAASILMSKNSSPGSLWWKLALLVLL